MKTVRLIVIAAVLRSRDAYARWLPRFVEPARERDHQRWLKERHDSTMAQLHRAGRDAGAAYAQFAGIGVTGFMETLRTRADDQ